MQQWSQVKAFIEYFRVHYSPSPAIFYCEADGYSIEWHAGCELIVVRLWPPDEEDSDQVSVEFHDVRRDYYIDRELSLCELSALFDTTLIPLLMSRGIRGIWPLK